MAQLKPLVNLAFIVNFLVYNASSQSSDVLNLAELMSYASGGESLCSKHISLLYKSLQTEEWAMQMFDASTKIPESVLTGLTTHLGNFDECIGVQNVQTEFGSFDGQYCLTSLNIPFDLTSTTKKVSDIVVGRDVVMEVDNQHREARQGGISLANAGGLTVAYCFPSSCSPQEFENFTNSFFSKPSTDFNISIQIADGMCQNSQGIQLATEDWVTIGVVMILAALSISSTAYDYLKKEPKKKLLTAFSWYSNGRKLLSTSSSKETLEAIHGIRFLSMCWVVLGHRYLTNASVPILNLIDIMDMVPDFWRLYLTNATLSVDSFFLLSGLLVSYIFLKQMKGRKSFNIPLYYIHRYLRLTPPYAMMILLQATILRYVSSGPLYRNAMELSAKECQDSWWAHLLYINNYIKQDNCVAQSWYLAVDMQLFFLSPIILIPLWKLPRKWSLSLLGVLIIGGLITAFTVSYAEGFPATFLTKDPNFMKLQYFPTHTRFTPWLIGIGFGYLFYETKKNSLKLSNVKIVLGWFMASAALLGSFIGIFSFYRKFTIESVNSGPKDDISKFEASIYTALSRPSWALGVGWIAYACVFGYGGPINTFLSWKLFQPLSRLTYCVFLVHMCYQTIQTMSARTPVYFSDLNTIPSFFGDVIVCSILAAILSLSVESPIIILEGYALGKGKSRSDEEKPLTETMQQNAESQEIIKPELETVVAIKSNDNTEEYDPQNMQESAVIHSGYSDNYPGISVNGSITQNGLMNSAFQKDES